MNCRRTPGRVGWCEWALPVSAALAATYGGLSLGCSSDDSPASETSAESALVSAANVCETAFGCENFDGFAAGTAPSGVWSASQNVGSVRIDATRAFSGTQAVKATTPATELAYKQALLSYRDPA